MKSEIPSARWFDFLLLYFGRRIGFEVKGDSMLPTLIDGDRVFVAPSNHIVAGDIVLADHPYRKNVRLIKRVASVDEIGNCFLEGDNPAESTDSKAFGVINAANILGKVTRRKPNARISSHQP